MDFSVATLGELSLGDGKYGIAASAVDYDAELPAYLRITDINDDGTLNWNDRKSVDDPAAYKYMLREGDIVFARTGNSTGKNYYYDSRDGEFAFAGFLIRFSLDDKKVNPRYVKYYAQSKAYWDWVASFNTGSTRGNINAKTYAQMPIPLPDRPTQDSIVMLCDSVSNKIRLNAKLNGYLEEQCEAVANREKGLAVELSSLCDLVKEKADYNEANFDTYVSTESLLPGKKGRQAPSSLPQTGKVTVYKDGDILVSNIRPYFKKIWYADRTGTCSGDVLVFRAKQPEQSGYLYSCMRSDAFFDYIMKGAKGTKMPRGDKKQMLTYKVASNPSGATVDFIESALSQASSSSKEKHRLAALRDVLLPKLMSGEIDVSKVDLKQLNSHLA